MTQSAATPGEPPLAGSETQHLACVEDVTTTRKLSGTGPDPPPGWVPVGPAAPGTG